MEGSKVHIRDTILLTSAAAQSLDAIGLTHGYKKLAVSMYNKQNMDKFMFEDYENFKQYGLRDSEIVLKHGLFMEEFNYKHSLTGVPVTLASVSKKYLSNKWREMGYKGYQSHPEYLQGKVSQTITPVPLRLLGREALYLSMYIAAYRGGRNESFMYGIDVDKR